MPQQGDRCEVRSYVSSMPAGPTEAQRVPVDGCVVAVAGGPVRSKSQLVTRLVQLSGVEVSFFVLRAKEGDMIRLLFDILTGTATIC